MTLALITAPSADPVTPADVRTRLGLDASVSDSVLLPLIKAACQAIDGPGGWLGRALISQTWLWRPSLLPGRCDPYRLPLTPVLSIASFQYPDAEGVLQDFSGYERLGDELVFTGSSWPHWRYGNPRIQFVAGFGVNPADVPEPIRTAVILRVGQMRSLSARDLSISSETVEGVGQTNYVVGSGAADATDRVVNDLLKPYRLVVM